MQEEYWRKFRQELTSKLKENDKLKNKDDYNDKIERSESIINMAKQIGVKATARYFNITPKSVRYWLNK